MRPTVIELLALCGCLAALGQQQQASAYNFLTGNNLNHNSNYNQQHPAAGREEELIRAENHAELASVDLDTIGRLKLMLERLLDSEPNWLLGPEANQRQRQQQQQQRERAADANTFAGSAGMKQHRADQQFQQQQLQQLQQSQQQQQRSGHKAIRDVQQVFMRLPPRFGKRNSPPVEPASPTGTEAALPQAAAAASQATSCPHSAAAAAPNLGGRSGAGVALAVGYPFEAALA